MAINPIKLPENRPARILVIHNAMALGYRMMGTPLMRGLRQGLPNANLCILTDSSGVSFYKDNPYGIHAFSINDERTFSVLRAAQFDLCIDIEQHEEAYLDLFHEGIRPQYRIGSNIQLAARMHKEPGELPDEIKFTHDIAPYRKRSYVSPGEYQGNLFLKYLEPLSIKHDNARPEIWFADQHRLKMYWDFKGEQIQKNDFVLGLNLQGKQTYSHWPVQRLSEFLAVFLVKYWEFYDRNIRVLVNYTEEQQTEFSRFKKALETTGNIDLITGVLNKEFGDLAAFVNRCSYILSTDTGTAHAAQALDIPATVLYPSEEMKESWLLPGARVIPVVSDTGKVGSIKALGVCTASIYGIESYLMAPAE